MLRFLRLLPLFALVVASGFAQSGDRRGEAQPPLPASIKVPPAPILRPEQEAATFKLAPGFRAELVAADPLIADPIALQFGPDGRLWVVEMRGFMPNVEGSGERDPVGTIAVLEDSDGDGRYDRRTTFADRLVLPRALALVGVGLLVAEPPHLWFLRDTDGDGVADAKTEVANDYGNPQNPEHSANGLLWAMDNLIYSADHAVRYRWLGGGQFAREATITRGQWGITQDDAGRLHYNSNSDPLRFDALPAEYLKRNYAFAAAGAAVPLVPGNLRIWPARVTAGVNRGYHTLDATGRLTSMTAASGPAIYRGALFPEEFRGDAFVPEPSAHLIKRIKLTARAGSVKGANAYHGSEFMTSTDERFRPVNLYNGPDGALYVVDFYRGIIQHRIYLTTFLRKQIEERGLDQGLHLGRIWRIAPTGAPRPDFRLALARATPAELVAKLADPNGWTRDTAQRLLVERRGARDELARLATDATQPPLARLHALWTLDGQGALSAGVVLAALDDRDPRVSAAAIRLSERFLGPPRGGREGGDAPPASGGVALFDRLVALVKTRAEPEVRLQLALTLGEVKTEAALDALRALAILAGDQPFLADAIVSGVAGRENELIEMLLRNSAAAAHGGEVLRLATSATLKSGDAERIERVFGMLGATVTPEWARIPMLAGVRHFLPKSPDGKAFAAALPIEPKPLLELAQRKEFPAARIAAQLLIHLKWPGKPGAERSGARPLTPEEQARFEAGQSLYAAVCAACHQPNGQGQPGLAPSLVYSRWVLGDPRILARIVLNGKTQENLIMPPWKAALDDESAAAVLTFIRRSWGHEAEPIAAPVVAEARAATATRQEPFTEADLEELAKSLPPSRRDRKSRPRS